MTKEEYLKDLCSASFDAFQAANRYIATGENEAKMLFSTYILKIYVISEKIEDSGLFKEKEVGDFLDEIYGNSVRPEKVFRDTLERIQFIRETIDNLGVE